MSDDTTPGRDLREQIAEALRTTVDDQIVAEWICCDPVRADHEMCSKADAARQMARTLLTDDPEWYDDGAPVLDAVMAVVQPELNRLHFLVDEAHQSLPIEQRRLLAISRMVFDGIAEGHPFTRDEAADLAQRIVDEIGHSVTDEPALGPSFRVEIERLQDLISRMRADYHTEIRQRAEAYQAAIASTAGDAMEHRLCGMNLHAAIRRAEQAEAEAKQLRDGLRYAANEIAMLIDRAWKARTEIDQLKAEVRAAMSEQHADEIERIITERKALPDEERRRLEAADAPLLRIQVAATAKKVERLEAEIKQLRGDKREWVKAADAYLQRAEEAEARLLQIESAQDPNNPYWRLRSDRHEATVARVKALAEDMRTWCSPHGLAVTYAQRIDEAIEPPEQDHVSEDEFAAIIVATLRRHRAEVHPEHDETCGNCAVIKGAPEVLTYGLDSSDLPAVREFVAEHDPRGEST